MYFIIDDIDRYIEESNRNNKINIFALTNKSKEVLTKYTKLWYEIEYLIKTINDGKASDYEKDFMKI